jgi:hypothetical protein
MLSQLQIELNFLVENVHFIEDYNQLEMIK